MFTRKRLVAALAGAVVVGLSGLAAAAPAEAASQQLTLAVYGPVYENVNAGAAGFATPIKVGRRLELQVKSGSRWKVVDTVKQDPYGGATFYGKVKRTSKAKESKGYEWRYFRMRARASGGLKEKVSKTQKVKLMLDPQVYYRVLRASVQSTSDSSQAINGCGAVTKMSVNEKTSGALGKAESGKPKWRAKRLVNGAFEADADPQIPLTWTDALKGCRRSPQPAPCEATRIERPAHGGKAPFLTRVTVPRKGAGSVLFFTRGVDVGYPNADDSVCNVTWIRSGDVPVKLRTKRVSRSTLLGKKPFTVVNQGQTSWKKNEIEGAPADISMRWTESITLQRVDAKGHKLK